MKKSFKIEANECIFQSTMSEHEYGKINSDVSLADLQKSQSQKL